MRSDWRGRLPGIRPSWVGARRSGSSRAGRQLLLLGLLVATALLAGCVGSHYQQFPQTTFEPLTEYGWKIQRLLELILWPAAFVFIAVEGALLYVVWRYRARPGQPRPRQVHGNTRLEVGWTIAPALVLAFIAVPTVRTIFDIGGQPPADAMRIEVIGHQWWWEFRYPDENPPIVTANEVHMPVGRNVSFEMQSADVIHAFWLPRLGGKRDVVPTHTSHIWLDAPNEPGPPEGYLGQCGEFCGTSHANMRMRAFVDSQADFDSWKRTQQSPAAQPAAAVGRGAEVFSRSACIGCHTVAGTSAAGQIGPNLTHVGGRTTIAAGLLNNTPEEMQRWIEDPGKVKPGVNMPAFKGTMSDEDLSAIVAYLQSLK